MVKCFGCGMNLTKILIKAAKIPGVNIVDKFGDHDKKKFKEFLDEEELDDCCRIILITYIPNNFLHHSV